MSYSYYYHDHRERSRSRSREVEDPYYSQPLVRRNSKRQRVDIYDDDEYDDYPYAANTKPAKPSRQLTIRQPTQLEKYNVWSEPASHYEDYYNDRHRESSDDSAKYKATMRKTYVSTRPYDSDDETRFDLKLKATIRRPSSSHAAKAMAWTGDMFRRKEKWVDEDWEAKSRERRDSVWEDEPKLKERTIRFRKIKRTRTDEWKPLAGFRHI